MTCSNCGHELAPDAKFCSNCGASVQPGASNTKSSGDSSPAGSERDWGGYSAGNDWGREASSTSTTPPPSDQPFTGEAFTDRKPDWELERERLRNADDEWAMSDPGPPRRRVRRTWLWVLLGMVALVVIACCVGMYWIAFTDSGTEWAESVIATGEALATETATETVDATPQP